MHYNYSLYFERDKLIIYGKTKNIIMNVKVRNHRNFPIQHKDTKNLSESIN